MLINQLAWSDQERLEAALKELWKCPCKIANTMALTLFDRHPEAEVLWTPWQRVEVFNGFRQAERAGLLQRGESRRMIRLLEQEVRLGYWAHVEFEKDP